ncbi:MAG: D-aminoacyl-tRNA deacylase [Dethiobacteria bacterium]|jgi:D-tyrosyl-tRNA(Tyr) deacylase|nr:D-tyrosyl-tRNA(Tyr) deacylase [Bacillota bacterium]
MRAVVQRVTKAAVKIEGKIVGEIKEGLVVFLGVGEDDREDDLLYLCDKIAGLRIFGDQEGKMNCSVVGLQKEVLCVSQFTLYGDCRRGRRPSFTAAAPPQRAEKMYKDFCTCLREQGIKVAEGVFGAVMQVEVSNDGPVTILLDSKKHF